MKRRFLSLALAFAFVLALACASPAHAEVLSSGACGENLTWVLTSDGALTISGSGKMTEYTS